MRVLSQYEETCGSCGGIKSKFGKCLECPTGIVKLYRYEDRLNEDTPHVYLRELKVIRETPHVWFVETFSGSSTYLAGISGVDRNPYEKRIYKDARRSFAYPTIELARNSFEIRKRKQLGYLSRQHDHVAAIVARIKAGTAYEPLAPRDEFEDFFLAEGAKL